MLLAFTAGSILTAPVAAQLAVRAGNRVLVIGGVLLVIRALVVALPAIRDDAASLWVLCGGLVVLGAGLGLLVVPLVNVVLSAVPADVSGGASGVFSTAQQIGGAVGVALISNVFFEHTTEPGLNDAVAHAAPYAAGAFALAALLCLVLPAPGR